MHAPPPPQPQQHCIPGRPHPRPPPPMTSSSTGNGNDRVTTTPVAKRTRSTRSAASVPSPPQPHPHPPATMMRNTADDAIAKRRAELRRLQQQREKSSAILTERLTAATNYSALPMTFATGDVVGAKKRTSEIFPGGMRSSNIAVTAEAADNHYHSHQHKFQHHRQSQLQQNNHVDAVPKQHPASTSAFSSLNGSTATGKGAVEGGFSLGGVVDSRGGGCLVSFDNVAGKGVHESYLTQPAPPPPHTAPNTITTASIPPAKTSSVTGVAASAGASVTNTLATNNTTDKTSLSSMEISRDAPTGNKTKFITTFITTATPRGVGLDGNNNNDDLKGETVIHSDQSTPIHSNHVEESFQNNFVGPTTTATVVVGNGENVSKETTDPDVNITLLHEAIPKENEEKVPEEEDNRPSSQSKNEKHNFDAEEENDSGNSNKNNSNNDSNFSKLKLDLERSEKEKLEALEELAKLKLLLKAGGIGGGDGTSFANDGTTPRWGDDIMMSTIDTPGRITPRDLSAVGGIITPRGGNTPNRFTPSRNNRAGVPPLAWNSPRSGNSRAGSRTGSPEHHHHHQYSSNTPRVRASPLPKQLNRVVSDTQLHNENGDSDNSDGAPKEERVEEEFLVAAARSIPNEYGTQLASYFVRRPHVTDDSLENDETDELAKVAIGIWRTCTFLSSSEDYTKHASVFHPESLEIIACIEADGSVFTLSGECNARHGKVSTRAASNGSFDEDDGNNAAKEYEWSVFDNVEDMDRALGRVSYIDEEGNERQYWLDSIYEEALTTRESYCTSMISAAFILKEVKGPLAHKREQAPSWNQTISPQPRPFQSVTVPPKSSLEGGLNASYPPTGKLSSAQSNAKSELQSKVENPLQLTPNEPSSISETAATANGSNDETNHKQASPPPEEYEPSDSALTIMVVHLFSLFFKLSWLVIKIPFRIGSTLFTVWTLMIALRVLCLFLADDNGAWDIGAGVEYEYNMPGIY